MIGIGFQSKEPSRWPSAALEVFWLVVAVGGPIVFNPLGANNFELPKSLLLRASALILLGLSLVRTLETGHRGNSRSRPLVWCGWGYGLALISATLLSVSFSSSLMGSYDRQQGLLTILSYLVLFSVIATQMDTYRQLKRLLLVLVWTSAPICAYGLIQAAGLDPLIWQTDAWSPVLSTLGRANFLGSYLVMVFPLTLATLWISQHRWPIVVLLLGQICCLFCTQVRAAWIGLGAGCFTFGLVQALCARKPKRAAGWLAMSTLFAAFLFLLNIPRGPLTLVTRLPVLDRLGSISRTDSGSNAARLTIWRATLPLIAAEPWLGYGPETMGTVFSRIFPPQLVYYQGRHKVTDRAHNLWMDLGMSTGLLGVSAFIALLSAFGLLAWRGLHGPSDSWNQIVWTGLVAAMGGHLVDLQFTFDLTGTGTIFWVLLGAAAALARGLKSETVCGPPFPRPLISLLYLLSAGVGLWLIALLCWRPFLADTSARTAQRVAHSLETRLIVARQAATLSPLEAKYRMDLSWLYMHMGEFSYAEREWREVNRLRPNDPWVWSALGTLNATWAEEEPGRFSHAEGAYRKALSLGPNIASFHTALGVILARQGRMKEAVFEMERAVDLDATDYIAYGHLSEAYRTLGRPGDAGRALMEARRLRDEKGAERRK